VWSPPSVPQHDRTTHGRRPHNRILCGRLVCAVVRSAFSITGERDRLPTTGELVRQVLYRASIVLVVDRRSIVKGTKIASGRSPIYKEVDRRSMPSKNVVV